LSHVAHHRQNGARVDEFWQNSGDEQVSRPWTAVTGSFELFKTLNFSRGQSDDEKCLGEIFLVVSRREK
jgi:hypothetical protein